MSLSMKERRDVILHRQNDTMSGQHVVFVFLELLHLVATLEGGFGGAFGGEQR